MRKDVVFARAGPARRVAVTGLLAALALTLSLLEGMLPPVPVLPPGAKLGLSNLAVMFEKGDGLNKDLCAAFYWFMQAAQRQDPAAQRRVALCYAEGIGVDKNTVKAQEWLLRAAQNGDMIAAKMLETSRYSVW